MKFCGLICWILLLLVLLLLLLLVLLKIASASTIMLLLRCFISPFPFPFPFLHLPPDFRFNLVRLDGSDDVRFQSALSYIGDPLGQNGTRSFDSGLQGQGQFFFLWLFNARTPHTFLDFGDNRAEGSRTSYLIKEPKSGRREECLSFTLRKCLKYYFYFSGTTSFPLSSGLTSAWPTRGREDFSWQ